MSSYGPDFLFKNTFDNLQIEASIVKSEHTTIFENTYTPSGRVQHLHSKADDLYVNLSTIHHDADILLLCPLTNEITIEDKAVAAFQGLKAATIQGWLRDFDSDGLVVPSIPDFSLFSNLDVIIMSEDDILGFEKDFLERLKEIVDTVVLTRGEHGAEVFHSRTTYFYPSYPTIPVDLTGAGDIFSIAFLYEYADSSDISLAASFAHAAASLSIEGKGVNAIPSYSQISDRQQLYNNRYL